ncbi:hypothetical protein F2P46_35015 [Massilia sp. CCM 8734]|nr:hypothetical protein [Massilia sp. CCM 8734]
MLSSEPISCQKWAPTPLHHAESGDQIHTRDQFCKCLLNLGRISKAALEPLAEAMPGAGADHEWNTFVQVRIAAHPALSQEQADVIRFEHFSGTASMTQTCRAALVRYFVQDVHAALDPLRQMPPEYQLAVDNIGEVRAWLFPA